MNNKKIFLVVSISWTIIWWVIAWSRINPFSSDSFFPLWLGFIFTINSISEYFYNTSLIRDLKLRFLWLFIISLPFWWGYEWLNSAFLHDWFYPVKSLTQYYSDIIKASLDFSTVIPAVSSVIYLAFKIWPKWKPHYKKTKSLTTSQVVEIEALAILTLFLLLYLPHEFFALAWITPLLIIDPINYKLGTPSVIGLINQENLKPILLIALAGLFTGFWWEMWNYLSSPKWHYVVPYFGFYKIFEMPILGYLGYLPFGLLTWSYTQLLRGYKKKTFN